VPQWRVYLGDGATWSDEDGDLADAPTLNVQAIAVADERLGRFILSGRDFYWHEHGRWWGGDHFGLWDYLQRPGLKKVAFGRTIRTDAFSRIMARALEDPDLPAKSAWDEREHRPEGAT
jgi:hypothetical protein